MAVLGVATRTGDPKELLAKYDQVGERLGLGSAQPQPGFVAHYCVGTDDGIMVVNIYESEQQLRAAAERPEFRRAVQEIVGEVVTPKIYQIHNMIQS